MSEKNQTCQRQIFLEKINSKSRKRKHAIINVQVIKTNTYIKIIIQKRKVVKSKIVLRKKNSQKNKHRYQDIINKRKIVKKVNSSREEKRNKNTNIDI